MKPDVIGWASSAVLVLTLAAQTRKQWLSPSTRGVSKWLYIGEVLAATGFIAYSALVHNAVYMVTNVLGLVTSLLGLFIFAHKRRREGRGSTA